jgi:hypothetical protein
MMSRNFPQTSEAARRVLEEWLQVRITQLNTRSALCEQLAVRVTKHFVCAPLTHLAH